MSDLTSPIGTVIFATSVYSVFDPIQDLAFAPQGQQFVATGVLFGPVHLEVLQIFQHDATT
jgi:hypothetical protein